MSKLDVAIFVVVVVAVLDPGARALAYLDPATGSMLLQLLLGGVAGALVVLKLYWWRFKEFFGFGAKEAGAASEETTHERQAEE